MSVETNTI